MLGDLMCQKQKTWSLILGSLTAHHLLSAGQVRGLYYQNDQHRLFLFGEWDLLMSLKRYRHFIESVICRFGSTTNRLGLNSQQTLRVLARRAFGHQACAEEGFTVSLTYCPVAIVFPVRRTKQLRVSPFIPAAAHLLVALAAKLTSPCGTIKFWIEWNKDLVTLMSAGRVSEGARL